MGPGLKLCSARHPLPPQRLTPEHLGTRPEATGAATARPGRTWSPQLARGFPECACPLVRVATCGRRGAHCAWGGPDARRGGAVAMASVAWPHTNGAARGAAFLPPDCLLQLFPSHPGPLLVPRTPLQEPEPQAGGGRGLGGNREALGCRTLASLLLTEKAQARGAEGLGRCGATLPGRRHPAGTAGHAAGSAGAAVEVGWLSGRGKERGNLTLLFPGLGWGGAEGLTHP